jgi:hypothetical protein
VSVNAEDLDMKLPKMTDLVNFWENKCVCICRNTYIMFTKSTALSDKNISFLEIQLRSTAIQKMLKVLMQEKSYSAKKLQEIIANTAVNIQSILEQQKSDAIFFIFSSSARN